MWNCQQLFSYFLAVLSVKINTALKLGTTLLKYPKYHWNISPLCIKHLQIVVHSQVNVQCAPTKCGNVHPQSGNVHPQSVTGGLRNRLELSSGSRHSQDNLPYPILAPNNCSAIWKKPPASERAQRKESWRFCTFWVGLWTTKGIKVVKYLCIKATIWFLLIFFESETVLFPIWLLRNIPTLSV